MSDARRHHFISQCYLKGFTDDGTKHGRLFAISLENGETFTPRPAQVAAERDFNRIGGADPAALETALSQAEGEIASALDRIIDSNSIADNENWGAVLNLVALFAVRHPAKRDQFGEFLAETTKTILGMALQSKERWASQVAQMKAAGVLDGEDEKVTYEQVREFYQRGEYDIKFDRSVYIGAELNSLDAVLHTLADRKWTLVIAPPGGGSFVTSDDPTCLMHSDGSAPTRASPVGHGVMGTTVLFPISSQLCAIGTFEGNAGTRAATAMQIAYLNGKVVSHAHRQIYAKDGDAKILTGIQKEPMSAVEFAAWICEAKSMSAPSNR